jgi:hypothetical protein
MYCIVVAMNGAEVYYHLEVGVTLTVKRRLLGDVI